MSSKSVNLKYTCFSYSLLPFKSLHSSSVSLETFLWANHCLAQPSCWTHLGKNVSEITMVSKYSKVLAMSSMLLTPAQTTVTGLLVNSVRSELMSKLDCAPLWTPPMPTTDAGSVCFVLQLLALTKTNVMGSASWISIVTFFYNFIVL